MLRIESIAVENLRGYRFTRLPLQKLSILVGENNEGKSSLLKMFSRLMNMSPDFWDGQRVLTDADSEFWYPANNARHKARRLTLTIKVLDGRVARGLQVEKGDTLDLRFAVAANGDYRLNLGSPKRNEVHDDRACQFLKDLQARTSVLFLPPIRDAQSSIFTEKATRAIKEKLLQKLQHSRQAGAPTEYRLAKEVISKIQRIVSLHKGGLSQSDDSPLSSMLRSSEVRVELFPKDVYELIERSMFVYLSTGDHDALRVLPKEVGNGLQSIIDINLSLDAVLNESSQKRNIIIVEEPEAFLHPSAQRQFMQFLRRALVDKVESAVLTTHSPIIVDEAKYEEVILVRNQRHFVPRDVERASKNTSLLTASSSEIFFARTIVFVEGEGDRAFFNALFKRIKAKARVCPELSGLVVQVTGGSTFFAPWLRLVRSYTWAMEDPFDCVWIMDGDAAADSGGQRPVIRAANDCGFNLPAAQSDHVVAFGNLPWVSESRSPSAANEANQALAKFGGHLFCCDLEWAFFNEASPQAIRDLKKGLTLADISVQENDTPVALARRLGSKIETGEASQGGRKQPYIRASIGEHLELSRLPPEIYRIVVRILQVCFKQPARLKEVIEACGIKADTRDTD